MRRAALLLIPLVLAAAGCATVAQPPTGITLLRHKPPEQGGPRAFPEASPSGVLNLSGPCVGVGVRPGETQILISSSKARVGRDGAATTSNIMAHGFGMANRSRAVAAILMNYRPHRLTGRCPRHAAKGRF